MTGSSTEEKERSSVKKIPLYLLICIFALLLLAGCGGSSDGDSSTGSTNLVYRFLADTEGWTGDFADYPIGKEDLYELSFTYAKLPPPLDPDKGALMLSGNNHSDDLFMFLKRKITGFKPGRIYNVTFMSSLPPKWPTAHGYRRQPRRRRSRQGGCHRDGASQNSRRLRILPDEQFDKENQSHGGRDMAILGDFSNGTDKNVYTLKTVAGGILTGSILFRSPFR